MAETVDDRGVVSRVRPRAAADAEVVARCLLKGRAALLVVGSAEDAEAYRGLVTHALHQRGAAVHWQRAEGRLVVGPASGSLLVRCTNTSEPAKLWGVEVAVLWTPRALDAEWAQACGRCLLAAGRQLGPYGVPRGKT